MTKSGEDALVRIALRETVRDDLPLFYEHQKDPEANRMAAFTPKDPADRQRFDEHWERILGADAIVVRTITAGGEVVGHISLFEMFGDLEVTYWLAKEHWGRGFATRALELFLREVTVRPLHGRAAKGNAASDRVLEKCGFRRCGEGSGFSDYLGEDVEEWVYVLEG